MQIQKFAKLIIDCFENNGKLLLCGNGGSYADCLHISGELLKTFEIRRKLNIKLPNGYKDIEKSLEPGFPVIVLGLNPVLNSAFINDCKCCDAIFAQECNVLCTKNDIVWGISTSGNSRNVISALLIAKQKQAKIISFTGNKESVLNKISDMSIIVRGKNTAEIQENMVRTYHSVCRNIEECFYEKHN